MPKPVTKSVRPLARKATVTPVAAVSTPNQTSFSTHHITPDSPEGQLSLDVYQSPGEIVVLAPIAGVKLSDINVSVTEDVLTIRGKRYFEFDIPEQDYLTQECFWGDFSRSIVLPAAVDTSKINASLKDCVLKITIPRTELTKTKVIRIKTE